MKSDITFGQYVEGNSVIHRLDPRVKILISLVYIVMIFLAKSATAFALLAVSAAVFGGVSTLGGIGSMAGAILGVAVIQIVTNGMDMMNFSTYLQQISIGAMLLIVLAFRHRKRH